MPKYKAHLTAGLVTFILTHKAILYFSPKIYNEYQSNLFLYLSLCLFGSLFPDIDTKSKIQKFFYIFTFSITSVLIISKEWFALSITTPIIFLPLLVNHRSIFHKIWFLSLIATSSLIAMHSYFNYNMQNTLFLLVFFITGCLSHIILDYGIIRFFKQKIIKRLFI